jgi:AraC family transcriptional regulator
MIVVDQDRHELADPAVDELVVSIPLEGGACGYEWNRGCAWISGQSRTGDLIVVPPGVESRWRVGGARKPVILAAPTALVRGMLGSDCPADLTNAFEPISGSSAPDPFVGAALHRLWSPGDSEEPLSRMFVDSVVLAVVWQLLLWRAGPPRGPRTAPFPHAIGDASASTSRRISMRRLCWSISPTQEGGAFATSRACSVGRQDRAPTGSFSENASIGRRIF